MQTHIFYTVEQSSIKTENPKVQNQNYNNYICSNEV